MQRPGNGAIHVLRQYDGVRVCDCALIRIRPMLTHWVSSMSLRPASAIVILCVATRRALISR